MVVSGTNSGPIFTSNPCSVYKFTRSRSQENQTLKFGFVWLQSAFKYFEKLGEEVLSATW